MIIYSSCWRCQILLGDFEKTSNTNVKKKSNSVSKSMPNRDLDLSQKNKLTSYQHKRQTSQASWNYKNSKKSSKRTKLQEKNF